MEIPGGTNYTIAYSNIYYLSSENRIYNFARANNRAPNFIYSDDNGKNWTFGGQLTTNSSNTYNKGYYKYWGNGVDRIDMVFTEQHPRDDTTSIYHGYISGNKVYSTDGKVADEDIYDLSEIPTFSSFTCQQECILPDYPLDPIIIQQNSSFNKSRDVPRNVETYRGTSLHWNRGTSLHWGRIRHRSIPYT